MKDLVTRLLLKNKYLEAAILPIYVSHIKPFVRVMGAKPGKIIIFSVGSYILIANGHRIIKSVISLVRCGPSVKTGLEIALFAAQYYAITDPAKWPIITVATVSSAIEAKIVYDKSIKTKITKEVVRDRKALSATLFAYLNIPVEQRFPKLTHLQEVARRGDLITPEIWVEVFAENELNLKIMKKIVDVDHKNNIENLGKKLLAIKQFDEVPTNENQSLTIAVLKTED